MSDHYFMSTSEEIALFSSSSAVVYAPTPSQPAWRRAPSSSSASESSSSSLASSAAASAASTPAGSAYSSPSLVNAASSVSRIALAPKIVLKKKREAPRAHTKIVSRTIMPSTSAKKVEPQLKGQIVVAPTPPRDSVGLAMSAAEQDAEIARDLPKIRFTKKDRFGAPFYRAWAPVADGGCPSEDHIVVLVHFARQGLETEETRTKPVYMTFAELKKSSIAPLKEVPLEVRFGADLMFREDEQRRADRLLRIDMGLAPASGPKAEARRGAFSAVWRTTYADCAGYDRFKARLVENLLKRSWADL